MCVGIQYEWCITVVVTLGFIFFFGINFYDYIKLCTIFQGLLLLRCCHWRPTSSAFPPNGSPLPKVLVPNSHPPLPASPPILADCSTPSDLRQPSTGPASHTVGHPLLITAEPDDTTIKPNWICPTRPAYLRLDSTRSSGPCSAGMPLAIASFSVHPPLTFVSSLAHVSLSVISSSLRTAASVSGLLLLAFVGAVFITRIPATR